LILSENGLRKARLILDNEATVTARTPLLPARVCEAVIAALTASFPRCSQSQATTFTAKLISRYPDMALKDLGFERSKSFKVYGLQVFEAFAAFSSAVCEAALAVPDGALAELTYTPKIPEIIKALKREQERLDRIVANAKTHMAEARRREKSRREEAEFEHKYPSPERRRQQVTALLGGLKTL
jgi:hypothetical protein